MGVTSSNPSEQSPKNRNQCISASAPAAEKVFASGKADGQFYWLEAPFSKANASDLFDAIWIKANPTVVTPPVTTPPTTTPPTTTTTPPTTETKTPETQAPVKTGETPAKKDESAKKEEKKSPKKEKVKVPENATVTLLQAKEAKTELLALSKDAGDAAVKEAKFEKIFDGAPSTGLTRDAFIFAYAKNYGVDGTKEENDFKADQEAKKKAKEEEKKKAEADKNKAKTGATTPPTTGGAPSTTTPPTSGAPPPTGAPKTEEQPKK